MCGGSEASTNGSSQFTFLFVVGALLAMVRGVRVIRAFPSDFDNDQCN